MWWRTKVILRNILVFPLFPVFGLVTWWRILRDDWRLEKSIQKWGGGLKWR